MNTTTRNRRALRSDALRAGRWGRIALGALVLAVGALVGCGERTPSGNGNDMESEDVKNAQAKGADAKDHGPFEMPIVVVEFFPMKDGKIDPDISREFHGTLDEARAHTDSITKDVITALEQGSRYHAYKNPDAKPSLVYKVLKTYEFLEPMPAVPKHGDELPMPDYNAIMERIDARSWVEDKGVKEIWIHGYHVTIGLWESNMSGPYGDISNSSRDPDDLPVFKKTYTVFHYNYGRSRNEALENHIHQIEHVLDYVDGRDVAPHDQWGTLLFWGKFVGSDISHKMIPTEEGFYRCGWAHYPPNAESDYDWRNKRVVLSDIEDWKPDGSGEKKEVTSSMWDGDSYKWFIYWMQSIPGMDNGLTDNGKPLRNWWFFIADFDTAMANTMKLVAE
jgi:hypothetical protein